MTERKRLERMYFNFCYHADISSKLYSFIEFENEYKQKLKFRIIVFIVIFLDSLKEKVLDIGDQL